MLGADRDLGRDDVRAERGLERVERAEEVGALAVEHVDEHQPREVELGGALPQPAGWTSTPITALTTKTADSHTRSAPSASATKLESPGVSSRLTLRSCHSNEDSAAEIDIWRAFSSGSESETVVPSTTVPEPVDHAGLEQQRLVQRGLATTAVADERHVADAIRGLVHACLLSGVRQLASGRAHAPHPWGRCMSGRGRATCCRLSS